MLRNLTQENNSYRLYVAAQTGLEFLIKASIQDLFEDVSNVHSYNTGSSASNNFYTKFSRLSVQANSFSRIGAKVWNEMPLAVKNFSENLCKKRSSKVYLAS